MRLRPRSFHQDGSRHAWLEGQPALDLIVTMDDATSEILSLFLVAEEGTASTFQGLREVVAEHGLFCALYTDRGSHCGGDGASPPDSCRNRCSAATGARVP